MNKCDANAPAFTLACEPGQNAPEFGLTKRELFAAMAMQGVVSRPGIVMPDHEAMVAVRCADALIAELNKEPQP